MVKQQDNRFYREPPKAYSLTKEGEGEFAYTDQDGVSWDSPALWLFIGILGGCGCGSADDFGEEALRLLKHFAIPHSERKWEFWEDRFYELMAHWFDDKGLIEHGGSVGGSWLSEKGKQILAVIEGVIKINAN